MTTEIFKDIQGYEGLYQVSDKGRVMGVKSERVLKPRVTHKGYHRVALYKEGVGKNYSVHRLVALAFISNQENKKEVNHIDGNKSNNSIENLEWNTREENQRHSIDVLGNTGPKGKFGASNPSSKAVIQLTKEGVEVKRFGSIIDAYGETGVWQQNIGKVCLGKQKTAGGYRWQFA